MLFEHYACFYILAKFGLLSGWSPFGKKLLIRLTICFLSIST